MNEMKNKSLIEHGMMLATLLYPIMMLSVKGSLSGLFFILAIMSILILYRGDSKPVAKDAAIYTFSAAMLSVIVVTVISQASHGKFNVSYWDSPARFMLAIPVYLALRRMDMWVIQPLQYGLPLGAIAALITTQAIHHQQANLFGTRATNLFLNPIHFGDLALMLGILSASSINWLRTDSKRLVTLKATGLIAGLCASALSGTRGGWVAIPMVLMAWFILGKKYTAKELLGSFLATISLLALSYFAFAPIQQRVNYSYSELQLIMAGNLDSSIGQRLQIWRGAAKIFLSNPIAGVGPDGFAAAISALGESGYISKLAAEQGVCEVHSQIFSSAARLGIFGLISYFLVHLVPLMFFSQSTKSTNPTIQKTGFMGVSLVTGFMVFGLTVEMYNLKMVATFYALTVAVLLAACHNIHHNEQITTR